MDHEIKEKIKKLEKGKWFNVWFAIEALAVNKEVVEKSLEEHLEKLEKAKDTFVYDKKFLEAKRVEKPIQGVEEGYSEVVEVKLFTKDMLSLISLVLTYGPSSVEILGPSRKDIRVDEVQNIANLISSIMHRFAASGVGGMIIAPGKS